MKTPIRPSADRLKRLDGPAALFASASLVLLAGLVFGLPQMVSAEPQVASVSARTSFARQASPAAVAGVGGTYLGKNQAGRPVRVLVRARRIVSFRSSIRVKCYFPSGRRTFEFPPGTTPDRSIPIDANGNFKVVFAGGKRASFVDDHRTLRGSFRNGHLTGSMRVEGLCHGRTAFAARRSQGRMLAGGPQMITGTVPPSTLQAAPET